MKYLLALFADESGWENATPEDMQAGMEPWNRFERELHDSGARIAGEGLRPSMEAKTVKLADGGATVSDGPFAEMKEQLGGFYLIDVDSVETALDLVRLLPDGYTIEVRPAIHIEGYDG